MLRRITDYARYPLLALGYRRFVANGCRSVKISFPERIGHLCLDIDCLLKDTLLKGGDTSKLVLLDMGEGFANSHIVNYYRSIMTVVKRSPALDYIRAFGDPAKVLLETNPYAVAMYDTAKAYDVYARWGARPPLFELTPEDQRVLEIYLSDSGVPPGAWYVCLHCRGGGYSPRDEAIHKFRSIDVRSFGLALDEIVRRGGWVVRMGDPTMEPFSPNQRVIDYARDARKTPQLDIALSAGCRFFLGTASGLFNVAEMFGRPCVVANMAPMGGAYAFAPDGLSIPQRLRIADGRILSLREIMADECRKYRLNDEFRERGLENLPNTPEEILEVTVEMLDRLADTAHYSPDDVRRQAEFRALFRPGDYSFGAASNIGCDFLRRHF